MLTISCSISGRQGDVVMVPPLETAGASVEGEPTRQGLGSFLVDFLFITSFHSNCPVVKGYSLMNST